MALLLGTKAIHPSAVANRPHILGYDTARSAAHDSLLEIWNGSTNASIKAAVDLNGKFYSNAWVAGDLPYIVAGGIANLKRMDTLAIGAANTVLTSSGSAPQWSTALNLSGAITARAPITASAGLPVASGPTLTGTGATITGLTAASVAAGTFPAGSFSMPTLAVTATLTVTSATITGLTAASVTAGTFPAGSFSMPTLAVTSGLTLTGATITGTPTWSSTQSMNISGSAGSTSGNAATATSAGKWTTARNLAGNSVDGSANVAFANKFIVQGTADTGLSAAQFLGALGTGIVKNTTTTGVLSIAVAGDFPTLNQNTTGTAATVTGAAQTAITSVGTLTSLTVGGAVTISASDGTALRMAISNTSATAAADTAIDILAGSSNTGDSILSFGLTGTGAWAFGRDFSQSNRLTLTWQAGTDQPTNVASGTEIFTISTSGGMIFGGATGGDKGAGTINAVAVYDDGTGPLTDYVFERFYGLTPKDRPEYEYLGLGALRAFTAKEYRLPMMPSRETFERERSLGRLVHGLWEATELHTTYLFDHEDRIAGLETENASLKAELAALKN